MKRAIFALGLILFPLSAQAVGPQVEEEPFGRTPATTTATGQRIPGQPITKYTLTNRAGAKCSVITYGGIVTNLYVPDRDGKMADVVLGFDSLDGYLAGHPYFGANVGRCANRIANAKFKLDGTEYTVTKPNDGPHTLHGGKVGFDKKVWKGQIHMTAAGPGVTLTYTSADKEEGYPGTLSVAITYTLTADSALRIEMSATTDKTTVCNIAHHSYFNLAGHNAGNILGHTAQFVAKNYTPGDDTLVPTGKIAPVAGTPFDFLTAQPIGARIKQIKADPVGYDLNYALDGPAGGQPMLAARMTDPKSGRMLELFTDQPGLQFYTGNFLKDVMGKGGAVYQQYGAFCLEPQKYPDAINKPEWCQGVLSPILKPGEEYRQTTVYKFGVVK